MSRTKKKSGRFTYQNQHATIKTYKNENSQVGGETFTSNRDDDFSAYISTDTSNATSVTIQFGGAEFRLTGREARTMQRLLNKHYTTCGRDVIEQPGF